MTLIKKTILNIIAHAVLIYIIANVAFISITIDGGLITYGIIGIILGFLSTFIKPILKILVLPASLLFGGLVTLIVNIVFLFLLQYILNVILAVEGFSIIFGHSWDYLIAGILFSILSGLIHWLLD